MEKKIYLEAVRGVAALVVVLCHFFSVFYPATLFGQEYRVHEPWELLFTSTPLGLLIAGKFAVCIFFILSGFVLSLQYFGAAAKDSNHLLAAAIKRPFRLGGLVVFSVILSYLLMRLSLYANGPVSEISYATPYFTQYWTAPIGLKQFLLDLSFKTFASASAYNGPLWTIEIELYGSFLTYAFLMLFRNSNWRWGAYVFTLLYFHGLFYQGFIFGIFWADVSRNAPARMAQWSRPALSLPLLGVGLFLGSFPAFIDPARLAGTLYGWPKVPALAGGYSMIGAVAFFAALLLSPGLQAALATPIFAFLGRISYSLYAIHFLVIGSLSSWLFLAVNRHLGYNASFAVVLVASLGFLFVLANFLSRFIDIPVTRGANWIGKMWLKSLGDHLPSRVGATPTEEVPATTKSR